MLDEQDWIHVGTYWLLLSLLMPRAGGARMKAHVRDLRRRMLLWAVRVNERCISLGM
jgi:hypothetical protein